MHISIANKGHEKLPTNSGAWTEGTINDQLAFIQNSKSSVVVTICKVDDMIKIA
jgi:hypothetical protein